MQENNMPVSKPPREQNNLRIYDNYVIPAWVPEGISWDELTPEEKQRIKDSYRFSGFRPNRYQMITGSMRALL
jgi:hypothetical protein